MPPVDKESLGRSGCLRALGAEVSLSLSLILLLPVLLLLSLCLSRLSVLPVPCLSGLIYLSPPTACRSLYSLTYILPPPLSSTPSALQQMNQATWLLIRRAVKANSRFPAATIRGLGRGGEAKIPLSFAPPFWLFHFVRGCKFPRCLSCAGARLGFVLSHQIHCGHFNQYVYTLFHIHKMNN